MYIPFSPPFIDDDIKKEVLSTLESGWITSGPKVLGLEKLVAENIGVEHVVCCNSATSGLLLMLHWYGVGSGDEVLVPAYTYAATALVVMHVGAIPVMVDVGSDFNLDVNDLKNKISARTKVIIPVDVAGWPCDYNAINGIVNSFAVRSLFVPQNPLQEKLGRILVLADAAHSIGARYHSRAIGLWADFTVFSFHAVKNITTAEGGAICINLPSHLFSNLAIYKELKLRSLNGQTKDALSKTQGGGWRYDIIYPGFKINMPDVCAAIGLAQLRKYPTLILPNRKRVFRSYSDSFSGFDWAELPPDDNLEKASSYHLYALRIRGITEKERDRIIDSVTLQGVSVNVHFQPLPLLTVFKERGYQIKDFPRSFDNYSREISLPIYPELDEEQIAFIVQAVNRAYHSTVSRA